MSIQEHTVRQQAAPLWEVRLGDRLLSWRLTRRAALNVAEDDGYAVEVSVRGMSPTMVSGFITLASAERWMAERRHSAVAP